MALDSDPNLPLKRVRKPKPMKRTRYARTIRSTATTKSDKQLTCPYCIQQVPYAMHRYNCQSAPYEVWLAFNIKRTNNKYSEGERKSWTSMCPHCRIKFPSTRAAAAHVVICRHRRVQAGLPVRD